jgi:hypothetical protein
LEIKLVEKKAFAKDGRSEVSDGSHNNTERYGKVIERYCAVYSHQKGKNKIALNAPHPFERPPGSSMTSALTTVPHDLNRSFKSCHFTSQLRLPTYMRHPKALGCVLKSTGG